MLLTIAVLVESTICHLAQAYVTEPLTSVGTTEARVVSINGQFTSRDGGGG